MVTKSQLWILIFSAIFYCKSESIESSDDWQFSSTNSIDPSDDATTTADSSDDITDTSTITTTHSICSIDVNSDSSDDDDDWCPYIAQMTFEFPYSLTTNITINETVIIQISKNITDSILSTYATDRQTINTTVTIQSAATMSIKSIVGITSENLYLNMTAEYNNNGISDNIVSDLSHAVNTEYNASDFVIDSDITSSFTVLNEVSSPSTTSANDGDDEIDEDLWGFTKFDFDEYRLYDWIVLSGCGLVLMICCFCGCFCTCLYLERRRYNKIPESKMNAATGSRISVYEMSPMSRNHSSTSNVMRPAARGLEYKFEPDPNDPASPRGPTKKDSSFKDKRTSQKFDAIIGGLAAVNKEALSPQETLDEVDNEEEDPLGQSFGVSFGRDNALNGTGNEEQEYIDYEAGNNEAIIAATPPMNGSMKERMTAQAQWV